MGRRGRPISNFGTAAARHRLAMQRYRSTPKGLKASRLAAKRFRKRNPAYSREKLRLYRSTPDGREATKESLRKYYKLHPPNLSPKRKRQKKEASRRYYSSPKGKIVSREASSRKRALLKNVPGSHTEAEWERLKKRYAYRCMHCLRPEKASRPLQKDHIIPLTWQGTSDCIRNIQPLCGQCNNSKGDRSAKDWRPSFKSRLALVP